jgi:hypothetical protein
MIEFYLFDLEFFAGDLIGNQNITEVWNINQVIHSDTSI